MTAPAPPEVLSTLALRPGMTVHDETPLAPGHVVADCTYVGEGGWLVSYVDGGSDVHGARHTWVVDGR